MYHFDWNDACNYTVVNYHYLGPCFACKRLLLFIVLVFCLLRFVNRHCPKWPFDQTLSFFFAPRLINKFKSFVSLPGLIGGTAGVYAFPNTNRTHIQSNTARPSLFQISFLSGNKVSCTVRQHSLL